MNTSITAQGGLLQVKIAVERESRKIGAKRKRIKRFTRASKKHLLDKFASLHVSKRRKIVFITLTYGQQYPSTERAKMNLEALFKRFDRRYAHWCGFWRLEFQERGAPHFHLLLFNMPFLKHEELAEMWAEIIGIEYCSNYESFGSEFIAGKQSEYPDGIINDFPMVDIELVTGKAKAMSYVAKYIAKGNEIAHAPNGASSFNFAAYPDALAAGAESASAEGAQPDKADREFVGRFWGICHEDRLPYAPAYAFKEVLEAEHWNSLIEAAEAHYPRLFTRIIGGEEKRIVGSFTLYVSNALQWVEFIYLVKLGVIH